MAQITVVSKSGTERITLIGKAASTSVYRKHLRSRVRQGNAEARVIGSEKIGFAIGVQVNDTVRIVSETFDRQFKALKWAARKLDSKPRKLLMLKAA